MRIILLFLFSGLVISCTEKAEKVIYYQDGQQILNANRVDFLGNSLEQAFIKTVAPDTIFAGDQFYAEVFLSNPTFKIVNAYFDCNVSDQSLVDTVRQQIVGCRKSLIVERDTVRISFRAGEIEGSKSFHELTLLSRDQYGIYRYHKGTFQYFVKP